MDTVLTGLPALLASAQRAYDAADYDALEKYALQALALAQREGNQTDQSAALRFAGIARAYHADDRGAEEAFTRALNISTAIGDARGVAFATLSLARLAIELRPDVGEAHRLVESCSPYLLASGDRDRLATILGNLSDISRLEGDFDRALDYAQQSRAIFEEVGDATRVGWQTINLALIQAFRRNYTASKSVLSELRGTLQHDLNPYWIAMYFDAWFMLAVRLRSWETACVLRGFVEQYRSEKRVTRLLGTMSWFTPCVELVERHTDGDRAAALRERGARMSVDEALDLASRM
jgi:tetratricopeptide (TPR) repeat protein